MKAYQMLASNACTALGYTGSPIADTSFTDSYVAEVAAQAMVKRRAEFPIVCGASPKESRRRNKQLHNAAMKDAKKVLGITLLAIVIGVLAGPAMAILAILGGVIGWMIEKELDERYGSMFSVAAMECA